MLDQARHNQGMWKRQEGFSMAEVLTVVLVLAVASAVGLPQLFGEKEGNYDKQAMYSLQTGWESAQDYYAGGRGLGNEEGPINSYSDFNDEQAVALAGDIPWQEVGNVSPAEERAKAVFIMEAGDQTSDQTIGLCSLSRERAYCMYDDGQGSGATGKVLGARYGVSICGTLDALRRAKENRNTDATLSWGSAQAEQSANPACLP